MSKIDWYKKEKSDSFSAKRVFNAVGAFFFCACTLFSFPILLMVIQGLLDSAELRYFFPAFFLVLLWPYALYCGVRAFANPKYWKNITICFVIYFAIGLISNILLVGKANIVKKTNEKLLGYKFKLAKPALYVEGFLREADPNNSKLYSVDRKLIGFYDNDYSDIDNHYTVQRPFRSKVIFANETLEVVDAFQIGSKILLRDRHPTYLVISDSKGVRSEIPKWKFEYFLKEQNEKLEQGYKLTEWYIDAIDILESDSSQILFKYCGYKDIQGKTTQFLTFLFYDNAKVTEVLEQPAGWKDRFQPGQYIEKKHQCILIKFSSLDEFSTFYIWFERYSNSKLISYVVPAKENK